MSKKKVIKEVEVKFTPAFEKAINGEVKIKKTKKVKATTKKSAKPTKVKAKTKTAKPKATAKPRKPRGYTITPVTRELTINGTKGTYNLFELAGPKMDKSKYFVTEEHAQRYVNDIEGENVVTKAFVTAVKRASSKTERKDLQATKELNELAGGSKPVIEKGWATYFNGPSLDVEETVKNNEDIDA